MRSLIITITMLLHGTTSFATEVYKRLDLLRIANPEKLSEVSVGVKSCAFGNSDSTAGTEVFNFMCQLQDQGQVQFATFDQQLSKSLVSSGPQTLSGIVLVNNDNSFAILKSDEFNKYVEWAVKSKCDEYQDQAKRQDHWGKCSGTTKQQADCEKTIAKERQKVRSKVDEACKVARTKIEAAYAAAKAKATPSSSSH